MVFVSKTIVFMDLDHIMHILHRQKTHFLNLQGKIVPNVVIFGGGTGGTGGTDSHARTDGRTDMRGYQTKQNAAERPQSNTQIHPF